MTAPRNIATTVSVLALLAFAAPLAPAQQPKQNTNPTQSAPTTPTTPAPTTGNMSSRSAQTTGQDTRQATRAGKNMQGKSTRRTYGYRARHHRAQQGTARHNRAYGYDAGSRARHASPPRREGM